jgi:hypothetical protein
MLGAEDLRRIALALPLTEERERWNHPTYDVAGRLFIAVRPIRPDAAGSASFAYRSCSRSHSALHAAPR